MSSSPSRLPRRRNTLTKQRPSPKMASHQREESVVIDGVTFILLPLPHQHSKQREQGAILPLALCFSLTRSQTLRRFSSSHPLPHHSHPHFLPSLPFPLLRSSSNPPKLLAPLSCALAAIQRPPKPEITAPPALLFPLIPLSTLPPRLPPTMTKKTAAMPNRPRSPNGRPYDLRRQL